MLHPVNGYFFQNIKAVVQSVTVGPRYGTGRFSLKSSVGQATLCVFVFKNVKSAAHFFLHQETIEVESENVFKLAAFALQVRKCRRIYRLNPQKLMKTIEARNIWKLLSFEAAAFEWLSKDKG